MQNIKEMKDELARECHSIEDVRDMLKNLFKDTLQEIFEAEMDEHLDHHKHSNQGDNSI